MRLGRTVSHGEGERRVKSDWTIAAVGDAMMVAVAAASLCFALQAPFSGDSDVVVQNAILFNELTSPR